LYLTCKDFSSFQFMIIYRKINNQKSIVKYNLTEQKERREDFNSSQLNKVRASAFAMIFSYKIMFLLSIYCLFFCNSAIADNRTNTTVDQHSIRFIFSYSNNSENYQKAQSDWKKIDRITRSKIRFFFSVNRILAHFYLIDWSKYIQIGAVDCANKNYSQWDIYCPLTNSTRLAFQSNRRTKVEDILRRLLKKANEIAEECYGKSWPIFKEIQ